MMNPASLLGKAGFFYVSFLVFPCIIRYNPLHLPSDFNMRGALI